MIQLKASAKGNFATRIAERIARWRESPTVAARIRVGDELKWWVYQEYGTAPYTILPVEANKLAFTTNGKQIITDIVHHPGIKPKRMVENVMGDIHESADTVIRSAFQENGADNPEIVRAAVRQATEVAKELIVERFHEVFKDAPRQNLSGREEQAGRLPGTTAAEAFNAGAVVVDVT